MSTISPSEFLSRKVPSRSNKEIRAYTYAEVLELLTEYGSECVLAEFERRGDFEVGKDRAKVIPAPDRQVPVQTFGAHGARWTCTCGKQCSSNHARVDVHCSCNRVWRKIDRIVTLHSYIVGGINPNVVKP